MMVNFLTGISLVASLVLGPVPVGAQETPAPPSVENAEALQALEAFDPFLALPKDQKELFEQIRNETAGLVEPFIGSLLRASSRFEVAALVDLLETERDPADQYQLLSRLTNERGTHAKLISELIKLYERSPERFDRLKTAVARLDMDLEIFRPLRPPLGSRLMNGLLFSSSLITYVYGHFETWANPNDPSDVQFWASRARIAAGGALIYVGMQIGAEILGLVKAWPAYRRSLKAYNRSTEMLESLKSHIVNIEKIQNLQLLRDSLKYMATDRPVQDLARAIPRLMTELERTSEIYRQDPSLLTQAQWFATQKPVQDWLKEFEAILSESEKNVLLGALKNPRNGFQIPWTLISKLQALETDLASRFEESLPPSDRGPDEKAAREKLLRLLRQSAERQEGLAKSAHPIPQVIFGNFTLSLSLAIVSVAVGVGNSPLAIDGHIMQSAVEWVRHHPQLLMWSAALAVVPSLYNPFGYAYSQIREYFKQKPRSPLWDLPYFHPKTAENEILQKLMIGRHRFNWPTAPNSGGGKACHRVHDF